MALTTNLGLLKPDRHDFVSVQTDINGNMEIIDTKTIRTPVTINGLENSDPVNPANVTVSVTGDFTGMVLLGYDIGDKHAFNTLSVVLTAGAMEVQSQIKAASSSTLVLYMGYQVGGRATNQTYVLDIDSAQWKAIDANTTKIGNTAMGTVATTLTGAIKEQGDLIKAVDKKMAIVVSGNTSTDNITAGDYVIVEDSIISTVDDGLYVAVNNVTAGTALVAADLSNSNTGLGGLNALNSKFSSRHLLWTNTSVNSGMGEGTQINFTRGDYNFYMVLSKFDTTSNVYETSIIDNSPNYYQQLVCHNSESQNIHIRRVLVNQNGMNVGLGVKISVEANKNYCIPLYVWGMY